MESSSKAERPNRIWPEFGRSIGILAAAFGGGWVLLHLDTLTELAILPALVGLVIWLWLLLPPRPVEQPLDRRLVIVGTLVAFGIGVFFRLRFFWTVPIGYNFEPLGFVFFAYKLVSEGFPYIPYAWYAHTLYSYFIAVTMLFVPSQLAAFRIASVSLSLATLVALYLCLRRLVSGRAAWIGVALLGSSYWHLFVSRNGYHQLQLPLFQLLFVYGLIDGVESRRYRGFLVAALAMVFGLHCHWGFYLMPVMWALFCAYLIAFHRDVWRETWKPMLSSAGLAAVLLLPLVYFYIFNAKVFEYIFAGFTTHASQTTDLWSKIVKNLSFVLWALSGHPQAQAEYGPVVDRIVAAAALLGFAASLRWFRTSMAHAALVLLFVINVVGLAVTVGNYFYIIATMAAEFCFAAIGLTIAMQGFERLTPRLAPALFALVLGLIGWQATLNYEEFFYKRIHREMAVPYRVPGAFYPLLDAVHDGVGKRAEYVPVDEPGRDFDAQLFELGRRIPAYSFVNRTLPYDSRTILFPEVRLGQMDGVEILLPNADFVERQTLPILRQLYPNLVDTAVAPPEPYVTKNPTPFARRIFIPRADVVRYHGLAHGYDAAGAPLREGFFLAPEDGRYTFRTEARRKLWLNGAEVPLDGNGTVLLEAGIHPMRVEDWHGTESSGISFRFGEEPWAVIDPYLANRGDLGSEVFEPYLARLGRRSDFYYTEIVAAPVPNAIQDAVLLPGGAFDAATTTTFMEFDAKGVQKRSVDMGPPRDLHLTRAGDTVLMFDANSVISRYVDGKLEKMKQSNCSPMDAVADGDRAVVLCGDGKLFATAGEQFSDKPLLDDKDVALVRPVEIALAPDGYYILDSSTSRLWLYDRQGKPLRYWIMDHTYWESDVATDPSGNLYVKKRGQGIKTYSADGFLLFHPVTGLPYLLTKEDKIAVDSISMLNVRFDADKMTAIIKHGLVFVYQRRNVGTK